MGFDFSNATTSFHLTLHGWLELAKLAYYYGWKPMGTTFGLKNVDPIDPMYELATEGKSMDYFTNSFRYMCEEDSKNLAIVLGKAAADPKQNVCKPQDLKHYSRLFKKGGFLIR